MKKTANEFYLFFTILFTNLKESNYFSLNLI